MSLCHGSERNYANETLVGSLPVDVLGRRRRAQAVVKDSHATGQHTNIRRDSIDQPVFRSGYWHVLPTRGDNQPLCHRQKNSRMGREYSTSALCRMLSSTWCSLLTGYELQVLEAWRLPAVVVGRRLIRPD